MSLFSKLKDAIFSKSKKTRPPANRPSAPSPKPDLEAVPEKPGSRDTPAVASGKEAPEAKLTAAELTAELDKMENAHAEDLKWRTSIVDLMKLVGMDSSYGERKGLALELGYSREDLDSKGSAEMNMWLHKTVMEKLSEDLDGNLDGK